MYRSEYVGVAKLHVRAHEINLGGSFEYEDHDVQAVLRVDPDLVVEEYLAGASVAEIAASHGRTPGVVTAILRRRGVRRRTGWDAPVDPAEVVGDYLSRDSLRTVAQRHGRSMTWVRKTLEPRAACTRTCRTS